METAAADLDLLEQAMNSTEPIPTLRYSFVVAIDIAIVITCILSILGAGAIIVSYLGFKELRTTSRFLLFHLSIADAVVAIAYMIGAGERTANLLLYQGIYNNNTMPLCIFTGAVGLYATDASILFTLAVMFYICLKVVCLRIPKLVNNVLLVSLMVLCWGIPLPIVIVYVVEGFFGYQPGYSPQFCTISGEINGSKYVTELLGYDLIFFISLIILPLLAVFAVFWFKCKVRQSVLAVDLGSMSYLVHNYCKSCP